MRNYSSKPQTPKKAGLKLYFPSSFKDAPTVYESYNEFLSKIVKDIRLLEKEASLYEKYSNKTEQMIEEITNDEISLKNLKDFYDDKYDFIPEICKRTGYYKNLGEENGY